MMEFIFTVLYCSIEFLLSGPSSMNLKRILSSPRTVHFKSEEVTELRNIVTKLYSGRNL